MTKQIMKLVLPQPLDGVHRVDSTGSHHLWVGKILGSLAECTPDRILGTEVGKLEDMKDMPAEDTRIRSMVRTGMNMGTDIVHLSGVQKP